MEVSGPQTAKDNMEGMIVATRRVIGRQPSIFLLTVGCSAVVGAVAAGILDPLLAPSGLLPTATLLVLTALFVWLWGCGALQRGAILRAWETRGHTFPSQQTFRITDDGFLAATPLFEMRTPWRGVSEVAQSPSGWVFILGGIGWQLPKTLFNDEETERSFVRAALERMSETARDRSPEAVAFVGVWG